MIDDDVIGFPIEKVTYTSKDFLTLRNELFSRLPSITQNKWTDLNEGDPGIAILELVASMADNLLFYLDMQGQELYLPTAKQRDSLTKLLQLIGYNIRGYTSAKGNVTVSVFPETYPIYPVTINKGTQFSATVAGVSNLVFSSLQTTELSGGNDSRIIPVVQGYYATQEFTSDGTPGQRIKIPVQNVDRDYVTININNGEDWTPVETFYRAVYNSTWFKTDIDEDSNVYIIFGDGQYGAIPPLDSKINITVLSNSGSSGNIGRGTITQVISGPPYVVDARGNGVRLSVFNSTTTSGGGDPEDLEQAKESAIALLFALRRALSRGDFKALMLTVPQVDKAIVWGENEEDNPDYRLINKVRACFFSNAYMDMYYNPASRNSYRALRDNSVRALLLERMPITTRLTFVDPILIDVYVSLLIGINIQRNDPSLIISKVRYALIQEFSLENVDFGQDIRISTINRVVSAVPGVQWSRVTRLSFYAPQVPDPAPVVPVDLVLEKWKIPNLIDQAGYRGSANVIIPVPPYIKISNFPPAIDIGTFDVMVVNPDDQLDIFSQGYTIFPGGNLPHISIEYTAVYDEPTPKGGYYGHPDPETDYTTYTSNQ